MKAADREPRSPRVGRQACGTRQSARGAGGAVLIASRGPKGLRPRRGLGKAIRYLREEKKVTGATLAERSDVSPSWLSRIEDRQVDPTWATFAGIASGLGV